MISHRKKKTDHLPYAAVRRNVVWSIFDYAVVPVGMLIATPILIHYLGLEQFGVLVLVTALVGFSAVFNFGFGDTALKYVSHYTKLNDEVRIVKIIQTIELLALGSGIVVGALFILLAPILVGLFRLDSLSYAIEVLYLTGLILPLKMMESVYVAVIRGRQRYDIAGGITVSSKILNIALHIVLAIQGYDLTILLVATVVTLIVSILLLFIFCCSMLGNLTPRFSRDAFREIRRFSLWSWTQGISGLVYANIDRLLVTAILGPSALGLYGICMQLAQNIHYGLTAACHSLFPRISMLNAVQSQQQEGDATAIRPIYLTVSRTLTVAAVLAGTLMAVFSYQILEIWVGKELAEEGYILLSLLSISFGWFSANSIVSYYTLNGLGHVRMQAGVSITSAFVMALSSVILIPVIGLVGAAIARLPDALFRVGVRIYIGRKIIGDIPIWNAIDFIRITLIILVPAYFVKELLSAWNPGENFFYDPASLLVLITFIVVIAAASYSIESRIAPISDKRRLIAIGELQK